MKVIKLFSKRPIYTIRVIKRHQKGALRRSLLKVKVALSQEKAETKEMLHIYHLYIRGRASSQDMKTANSQFFDILKGLGIGVFAVLPFAPITIPIFVKLGKVVGVDILPSAFNNQGKTADKAQSLSLEDKSHKQINEPINAQTDAKKPVK